MRKRYVSPIAALVLVLVAGLSAGPAPAAGAAPVAVDGSATGSAGQYLPVDLSELATDADFDPLSFVVVTPPTNGTLDDCSYGYCSYTPGTGFSGSDSFTWKANDGDTDSNTATFSLTITPPPPPCAPGACIDNGTVLLAVNPQGHLNIVNTGDTSVLWPNGYLNKPLGLAFIPTGSESTAPGCLCEGWGVADVGSSVAGYANVSSDGGAVNMTVDSFNATDSTAVSTVIVSGTFQVTHDYHPAAATANLYEANVTIKNISASTLTDVRYRRVMDWDIEPTPFSEFVTIEQGTAKNLLFTSDNGFATANPLVSDSGISFTGEKVDDGPNDHGALFDFGFGALDAGKSVTFKIFYGAAATEAEANTAIANVGAEAYSLGQPSTPEGPSLGTPNTFIFAFSGVGGAPVFAPVANPDSITTPTNQSGSVNVLANDSDPNGDPLTVTTLTPTAAHGTVSCTAAGLCTYTASSGYVGADSFTYGISDGTGGTATGTVSVTVTRLNRAPTASAQSVTTVQDTAMAITLSGSDPDGDALTFAIVSPPAHGTLSGAGAGQTYTPAAGYVGADAFTFKVNDGTVDSAAATVTITVTASVPAKTPSTTTLTVSPVKKLTPTKKVTLVATVSPTSATGSVTFRDSGHVLGTAPLSGGKATLRVKGLYGGTNSLVAEYLGSDTVAGSVSAPVVVKVRDKKKPSITRFKIGRSAEPPVATFLIKDAGGVRETQVKYRMSQPGQTKLGAWSPVTVIPGAAKSWTGSPVPDRTKMCVSVRAQDYAGNWSKWKTKCRILRTP